MLSDAFKELLEIQMERYDAMLNDCAPFTSSTHEGDATLHQRIVKDVTELKSLTENFMEAAGKAQTNDEKSAALKSFAQSSYISSYLWDHLYQNMDMVSPFRKSAVSKHAAMMDTIRKENVMTNVTVGWELVESMLDIKTPEAVSPAQTGQDLPVTEPQKKKPPKGKGGGHLRVIK